MIALAINILPQPLPFARQIGLACHPADHPAGHRTGAG